MTPNFDGSFPTFASLLDRAFLEQVLPPLSDEKIAEIEAELGLELPRSYKLFLRCCGGLWLFGGAVQFSSGHPFFHNFPALDALTLEQRRQVSQRGASWPPPSQGMLCFAEYFLQADGDQVLFKVDAGLQDKEYPVYYYAHDDNPPSVARVADSFGAWLDKTCIQSFPLDEE